MKDTNILWQMYYFRFKGKENVMLLIAKDIKEFDQKLFKHYRLLKEDVEIVKVENEYKDLSKVKEQIPLL